MKTEIKHAVLTTALDKTPEDLIRNPYKDRKINSGLLYTGEGTLRRPKDGEGKSGLETTNGKEDVSEIYFLRSIIG